MLEIVTDTPLPHADDLCFVFAGHDAVASLLRSPEQPWQRSELEAEFGTTDPGVFVGRWGGRACYAIDIDRTRLDALRHIAGSLYSLLGRVSDASFHAYGRALQMLNWRRDHRFCGRCGNPMAIADAGRGMRCADCDHINYPRIAPCAIFLITRGKEMLLAAANHRRANFYSTLAGFVEPGETCEATVIREAREEVGVVVDNVRYFGSQPWPFPGQLMLGFVADWVSGDIRVDQDEIAHADWFTADNLPPVPPRASISGQLISHFSQQQLP